MSTDVKELLAELFDTVLSEPNKNYDKCYKAARAIEAQAKQIEELSAALAVKDEALAEILRVHANDNIRPKAFYIADEALALQPHASILNKIRADAVREAARDLYGMSAKEMLNCADRIEKAER